MKINVAFAPFCSPCTSVVTLGIRPGIEDYTIEERKLIRMADKIFFPTPRFMDVFEAAGKPTFPSPQSCRYQRSRVVQTLLFQELGWPHPSTRLYFGNRRKQDIPGDFRMPFWAMGPLTHPPSTYRIESLADLEVVAGTLNPLVIREMVPWEEKIRLISVNYECLAAQRIGGKPQPDSPVEPVSIKHPGLSGLLDLNRSLTQWLHLDDIAMEWGYHGGRWHFIEMSRPPLHIQTSDHNISRHSHICELIDRGIL